MVICSIDRFVHLYTLQMIPLYTFNNKLPFFHNCPSSEFVLSTRSGNKVATRLTSIIPTKWALHPASVIHSINLLTSLSSGQNTTRSGLGIISPILFSALFLISAASSGVGSIGVGPGYPSSGNNNFSARSMRRKESLGVSWEERRCGIMLLRRLSAYSSR